MVTDRADKSHSGKKRVLARFLLVLALVIGVIWLNHPREPKDHGKTLSEWLEETDHGDPDTFAPVDAAVRRMGTNALPFLLNMVQAKDSRLKQTICAWAENHLQYTLPLRRAYDAHVHAGMGFSALDGVDARRATPALMKLLDDPDYGVRVCAFDCLMQSKLDDTTQRLVLTKASSFSPQAVRWLRLLDREAAKSNNAANVSSNRIVAAATNVLDIQPATNLPETMDLEPKTNAVAPIAP